MSHSARTLPLRHARRDKPTAASQPYAGGAPKTRRARAARASSGPQLWRRTIARMARLNALACQLLIRMPSESETETDIQATFTSHQDNSPKAHQQLRIGFIKALREFLDDGGLARWRELQIRQLSSDFRFPVRHRCATLSFELRESFIWRRADWRNARPFPFQPTMQSALRFVRA